MNVMMGVPAPEVAELLCISESTVYRYAKRFHMTGEVRKFTKRNGPHSDLSEFDLLQITAWVGQKL